MLGLTLYYIHTLIRFIENLSDDIEMKLSKSITYTISLLDTKRDCNIFAASLNSERSIVMAHYYIYNNIKFYQTWKYFPTNGENIKYFEHLNLVLHSYLYIFNYDLAIALYFFGKRNIIGAQITTLKDMLTSGNLSSFSYSLRYYKYSLNKQIYYTMFNFSREYNKEG